MSGRYRSQVSDRESAALLTSALHLPFLSKLAAVLLSLPVGALPQEGPSVAQEASGRVAGAAVALSYSGYRAGQHPDRGTGGVHPSKAQVLEDMRILVKQGVGLIRMYDAGEHTETTLEVIREETLPVRVLVGAWLRAEFSNHAGCPWMNTPIPPEELARNRLENATELGRAIGLARTYPNIVCAVSVGNEALVEWTDHMVPVETVLGYVRTVKAAIDQPVTVAENYDWWAKSGATLAAELDFLGVHTYPVWEGRAAADGLNHTTENLKRVHAALPKATIAILEAGWATTASEFGERAGAAPQEQYVSELLAWAARSNVTVFLFEAFDEPWKGDPGNANGAEKHWGLWDVERRPKAAVQALTKALAADGAKER